MHKYIWRYLQTNSQVGEGEVAVHGLSLEGAQWDEVNFQCCLFQCSNEECALYPCSTKTREVLGNPSPTPERFPETREISRVEGNVHNTSRVLVEYGHSLIINLSTGSGSENPSLWTGKD